MSAPSLTIKNRRYVWADTPTQAKDKIASELRGEGIITALQPELVVTWTGVTRPGSYDYRGNESDGYTEQIGKSQRRYAVDIGR